MEVLLPSSQQRVRMFWARAAGHLPQILHRHIRQRPNRRHRSFVPWPRPIFSSWFGSH